MICIKGIFLTLFTHLLFMMFVFKTLKKDTTKEMIMQIMSNFSNQEFQITEYMTLATLKNEKFTFTSLCMIQ